MIGWIFAVLIIIFFCFVTGFVLDKKIKEGGIRERSYTRLTMWIVIVSLASVLIMSLSLLLNVSILEQTKNALKAQSEGIAPIAPTLIPKIVDKDYNLFVRYWDVGDMYKVENNTKIFPRKESLDFNIRNSGQTTSGPINLFIKNIEKEFDFSSGYIASIEPFDFEYVEIDYWNKNCQSSSEPEEFKELIRKCSENPINGGIKNWILKIDCNTCPVTEECYSFKTCIMNETVKKENCLEDNNRGWNLIKLDDCSMWNNT